MAYKLREFLIIRLRPFIDAEIQLLWLDQNVIQMPKRGKMLQPGGSKGTHSLQISTKQAFRAYAAYDLNILTRLLSWHESALFLGLSLHVMRLTMETNIVP